MNIERLTEEIKRLTEEIKRDKVMNILIHRYNSICEPDFIEAFKSLGIEVIEDSAEMTDKNIPIEKKIAALGEMILTHHPMFVFSINFFPYISMVCEKLGVMYVCVSVDCPVVELFSEQIRNKCNRVFLFDYAQYMDIHDENPDCIFYMPLGVNVSRLDATIGEPDWDVMLNAVSGDETKSVYKYDVSFIGSLYNEKNPYPDIYQKLPDRYKGMCDGLLAAQELFNGQELLEKAATDELVEAIKKVDGDRFFGAEYNVVDVDRFTTVNDYLSKELTVRDRANLLASISMYMKIYDEEMGIDSAKSHKLHLFTRSNTDRLLAIAPDIQLHGGVKTLTEMPLIFRESKINLNPTMRSIRTGLPQRIWDVLGSGGFLLTNYQTELPEYLEVGTHLAAYETIDEACELIQYYLEHEEERIQIAKNGYEIAKNKHTVQNRVVEIIKTISDSGIA